MPRSNRKPAPPDSQVVALDDSLSSLASSAQKRAAPETIVLDDDDEDGTTEHLHAQYQVTALKAFAADKKKQKKASPVKATPPRAVSAFASRLRSSSKRNGNSPESMDIDEEEQKPPSVPDAIDVDDVAVSNDPSSLYRRLLGPLRFDFIDSFRHHNFLNEKQAPSMQKLMPKLYKELLEYRLNLPSEVSGSIFVRALESRMDIIRALVTGEYGPMDSRDEDAIEDITNPCLAHRSILIQAPRALHMPMAASCLIFISAIIRRRLPRSNS